MAPIDTDHEKPEDAAVHVVFGGDLIAAFADPQAAETQHLAMVGANLDTARLTFTARQWRLVRTALNPTVKLSDLSGVSEG
jgi:hypothetical protein